MADKTGTSGPSAGDIANAVLSAAQVTPIKAECAKTPAYFNTSTGEVSVPL